MRAKTIKNKPQVNEIVSDATMMKRQEREIKELRSRLAEALEKNESQIKVGQLEQRIKSEVLKIITCNSLHNIRSQREKRRRTLCRMSSNPEASSQASIYSALPVPVTTNILAPSSSTRLQLQKPFHFTPHITLRNPPDNQSALIETENLVQKNNEQERFQPAELWNFEKFSSSSLQRDQCKTPNQDTLRTLSLTPKATANADTKLVHINSVYCGISKF